MDKNESEQIIREVIEYTNREIQKSKRRSRRVVGCVILGVLALLLCYQMVFHYEFSVPYRDGMIKVVIPEDEGIDIHVELKNYKAANALLIQTGDSTYDLYIGVSHTPATMLIKDFDIHNNFLRAGNGILLDHQSGLFQGAIPGENKEDSIRRIYYLDDYFTEVATMTNQELMEYEGKTLIWERNA